MNPLNIGDGNESCHKAEDMGSTAGPFQREEKKKENSGKY